MLINHLRRLCPLQPTADAHNRIGLANVSPLNIFQAPAQSGSEKANESQRQKTDDSS